MKPAVKYLVVWAATLVLAVQVALVLYYVKPELFQALNPSVPVPAAVPAAASGKQTDSLIAAIDTARYCA